MSDANNNVIPMSPSTIPQRAEGFGGESYNPTPDASVISNQSQIPSPTPSPTPAAD